MSCYFMAHIRITDDKEYQKYLDEAGELFKNYKGSYLAIDNMPMVLEGNWDYSRAVLINFESKEDFEAWYHSEDYQRILKYRLNAAHCDTILISGS